MNSDLRSEKAKPSPIWCVAANVRNDIPSGQDALETRRGTRKFHGGAKVYLADAYWGTGAERISVVGHYRGKELITCAIDVRYLTNWRAELVYSPAVIKRLTGTSFKWNGSTDSRLRAEKHARQFSMFSDELHNERLGQRWLKTIWIMITSHFNRA